MSGKRYHWILAVLGLLILLPAGAFAQDKVLELDLLPGGPEPIPPDCSTWHELWPSFCASSHQDSLEDNGDGLLTACDYIYLDGQRFHVDWVGPTYYLNCDILIEPSDYQEGDPICQTWIEVTPNYGALWHVDDWVDNGDGVVSVCDDIIISGGASGEVLTCHIDDIRTNIRVTGDPTATEESSWSQFKSLFGF